MSVNSHFLNLDTDVTLSSNSDTIIPSQKAIKTYADNKLIFFATSTSAKTDVEKVVSIPSITSLEVGTVIVIQPTITSTVANSTIKLNNFTAYPMRYNNAAITTDTDSVVWNANYPCMWVFDGQYWKLLAKGLDSNTTYTLNYLIDAGVARAGGESSADYAVSRYSLVMQKPDMTWEKITAVNSTYSTGTTKSVNTNGFLPGYIKYYSSTTEVMGLGTIASNTLREQTNTLDLRYSTNCGDTTTWSQSEYIYLVGTITNGLFYLDETTWWSNALPTNNDGKYYMRLGYVISDNSYSISLLIDHPIFYHNGTSLCTYQVGDNKLDVSTAANTYLPLAGGTMTGAIQWKDSNNRVCALQLTTDGNKNLDFGWDWATSAGAGCALRSTSHSESGYFYFFARNGSNTTQLRGTPAGSLTWGGSEVLRVNKIDGTTIKANSSNVISVDQSALTDKQDTITGGASSITSTDLTAARALESDANGKVSVSSVTSTELGYLSGVTSAIQTQLNGKQATITGGASSIVSNNFTANRVVISNSSGKAASSSVTSTELGYLSGVTSSIQTQLSDKQPKTLDTAIVVDGTSQTTVEGALGAINTLAESKVEYAMVIKEW